MTGVTAADVELHLTEAERLLARPDPDALWLRGAVWLARIALERSVRQAWALRYPEAEVRGMRNLLLALETVTDADTRRAATTSWHVLSRAGHHHHCELAPTSAEVREWVADVRRVIDRIGSREHRDGARPGRA